MNLQIFFEFFFKKLKYSLHKFVLLTSNYYKTTLPMPNSTPLINQIPSETTLSFLREFAHSIRLIKTNNQSIAYSIN